MEFHNDILCVCVCVFFLPSKDVHILSRPNNRSDFLGKKKELYVYSIAYLQIVHDTNPITWCSVLFQLLA